MKGRKETNDVQQLGEAPASSARRDGKKRDLKPKISSEKTFWHKGEKGGKEVNWLPQWNRVGGNLVNPIGENREKLQTTLWGGSKVSRTNGGKETRPKSQRHQNAGGETSNQGRQGRSREIGGEDGLLPTHGKEKRSIRKKRGLKLYISKGFER